MLFTFYTGIPKNNYYGPSQHLLNSGSSHLSFIQVRNWTKVKTLKNLDFFLFKSSSALVKTDHSEMF